MTRAPRTTWCGRCDTQLTWCSSGTCRSASTGWADSSRSRRATRHLKTSGRCVPLAAERPC
eukprot:1649951-Heterocapsa_arctica.AAC.1